MSRVDPLRITHSRLVRKAVRRLAVLGALLAGLTITRLAAASGAEDPIVALCQVNAATTPVSFVLTSTAPDALKGLVGRNSRPTACTP